MVISIRFYTHITLLCDGKESLNLGTRANCLVVGRNRCFMTNCVENVSNVNSVNNSPKLVGNVEIWTFISQHPLTYHHWPITKVPQCSMLPSEKLFQQIVSNYFFFALAPTWKNIKEKILRKNITKQTCKIELKNIETWKWNIVIFDFEKFTTKKIIRTSHVLCHFF